MGAGSPSRRVLHSLVFSVAPSFCAPAGHLGQGAPVSPDIQRAQPAHRASAARTAKPALSRR